MTGPDAVRSRITGLPKRFAAQPADLMLPGFILLLALGTAAIEPRFLSLGNPTNLARQLVPLLILSVGQGFAIISGGLDLSLASVMSLAGVGGITLAPTLGLPLGVAAMLAIGVLCGAANGAIIAYLRTTPLIVTLGMLSITQAIALIVSNGVPIYGVPEILTDRIGFGTLMGVPVTLLIGLALLAVCWLLLARTIFGRYVYAIGSSLPAALKSGIDVRRTTLLVYVVSGACAGVGAIVLTAWVGAAQPIAEPSLTLQSLAAVVLGGVALTGGRGGMLHVVYGVLILGMLSNAMNMLGISAYFQTLAVGIVIIIAVILDRLRRADA
jgi:ribose/xylose/arabinose/galactoside ABC-type transport system permease subunit